ncbi:hypothetical protein C475_09007 [Halosimplex carlsbadense 2-9-1]|uniref:Uncharacterized protein n=1 Tax=Halosimplex carlsbadense 2-9-1 TaxID=797114 RepID=M0CVC3_9EURY|nr:hypothetical protein [Halosimplex carlsbadense]ELZ26553.1 hypothetical protein C475_09007 [Halosimplex carlsbadense 2-9-1]
MLEVYRHRDDGLQYIGRIEDGQPVNKRVRVLLPDPKWQALDEDQLHQRWDKYPVVAFRPDEVAHLDADVTVHPDVDLEPHAE